MAVARAVEEQAQGNNLQVEVVGIGSTVRAVAFAGVARCL